MRLVRDLHLTLIAFVLYPSAPQNAQRLEPASTDRTPAAIMPHARPAAHCECNPAPRPTEHEDRYEHLHSWQLQFTKCHEHRIKVMYSSQADPLRQVRVLAATESCCKLPNWWEPQPLSLCPLIHTKGKPVPPLRTLRTEEAHLHHT
ncbi:hypothetical protein NDU88_005297 [Pleurodeles waltl]|uniref:Secreted protein n=1 Tax=Pleurodeles waltl TaxID=8319 RepID=A0AAV7RLV7_PLEWA|nr:hypothetical protein NDU88_005297 [Pleurodeles waltl]